jgi:RNA polymerase sigma-70 factor (ECF subfamily)
MPPDPSFDDLMTRLRAGDETAAEEIFQRFAGRLIALARSRLDSLVRRRMDPEDVLQSVFRSFFQRHADGRITLEGWESLWSLLTVLTLRKCGRKIVYHRAARRDVRRVASPANPDDTALAGAMAREPAPEEAAMLTEIVEQLLRGLSQREQEIVVLGLQGYGSSEIAAQVHCTERTIQRILARIRGRLEAATTRDLSPDCDQALDIP